MLFLDPNTSLDICCLNHMLIHVTPIWLDPYFNANSHICKIDLGYVANSHICILTILQVHIHDIHVDYFASSHL